MHITSSTFKSQRKSDRLKKGEWNFSSSDPRQKSGLREKSPDDKKKDKK